MAVDELGSDDGVSGKKPRRRKKSSGGVPLVVVVSGLLAVGGAVGGLYLLGLVPGSGSESVEQAATAGSQRTNKNSTTSKLYYIPLDPAFVVNFVGDRQIRFLQVSMEATATDPMVREVIEYHMPAIRNTLIMLLSSQNYETLSTLDGKEQIRQQVLKAVQGILLQETGQPGISAIYFTSFVMQ